MNTPRYRVRAWGGAGTRRYVVPPLGGRARCRLKAELHTGVRHSPPGFGVRGGFSLIEVMVAVVILGVSLVGLVHGINTALVSGKEAEAQSQAALLAASQIESLRADGIYVEGETTGEFDGDLSVYSYRQNIEARQPEGLYEVTVAIEKSDSNEQIYE